MTPRPPLPLDLPLGVRRAMHGRPDGAGLAITHTLRLPGHVRTG